MGDPIVIYDRYADRFLITEFYSNGFDVAISQGSNPVTSGWYVYRFPTNSFPDYPKFSVWSDGYYITANKNSGTAGTSQVVLRSTGEDDCRESCCHHAGISLARDHNLRLYSRWDSMLTGQ
ncbi:MAG: hypothetical protein IPH20_12410 [Bacteroidales bacterium]|nr:hypothetical protein [Bacteroidales bacterium]